MLSYLEAVQILKSELSSFIPQEKIVHINDASDTVLARDIISDLDLPPFDNSAMDGYAIKFSENKKTFTVSAEIPAGNYRKSEHDTSTALRIMTGGFIPKGFDTIIPIEYVIDKNNEIEINANYEYQKGDFVRKKGSDLLSNRIALRAGELLTPQKIALCATCGREKLQIFAPISASIFSTGNELVDINTVPNKDKIRSSNIYGLVAALKEINVNVTNLGVIKDDKTALKKELNKFISGKSTILITTGGVSVGKYDFMKELFVECGADIIFDKVWIKPGKPTVFAKIKTGDSFKYIFGLPGNPVSSYVTFILFVKPFLQSLMQRNSNNIVTAKLLTPIKKEDDKRHFVRGIITFSTETGEYSVMKTGSQSSGDLVTLSNSNALIVLEESDSLLEKGTLVECIKI